MNGTIVHGLRILGLASLFVFFFASIASYLSTTSTSVSEDKSQVERAVYQRAFEDYLREKGDDDFKGASELPEGGSTNNNLTCSSKEISHNFRERTKHAKCVDIWKSLRDSTSIAEMNAFKQGYCHPVTSAASLEWSVHNLSTYTCPRHTSKLLQQQYHSALFQDQPTYFDGAYFLSLLQNKHVLLIGDSLAKQLFHALDVELDNFQDKSSLEYTNPNIYGGNGTHTYFSRYVFFQTDSKSKKMKMKLEPLYDPPPDYKAAWRLYTKYNASIFWCNDGTLYEFAINDKTQGQWQFCSHRLLKSLQSIRNTILIIGIGAHYKPPDNAKSLNEYLASLAFQTQVFRNFSIVIRDRLYQAGYRPHQILWQNVGHVGNIDETNSLSKDDIERGEVPLVIKHQDGMAWSHPKVKEAMWVKEFNNVILGIADKHGDHVINLNEVSHQLMKYSSTQMQRSGSKGPLRLHADSLHWCAGSLFRASLLLVQNILRFNKQCAKN